MWKKTTDEPAKGTRYGTGIAGAALIAAATLLLDPRSGRRRRALIRDKLIHSTKKSQEFLGKATRDARERARGLYEGTASRFREHDGDDSIVAARARTELGRLTGHPGAIEINCHEGVLHLQGHVLAQDADAVVRGLGHVFGVKQIVNEMRVHDQAGNIPSLQGEGSTRRTPRFEYLQETWSPAPRLIAAGAGCAMLLGGIGRRGSVGYGLAAAGAALLVRSICNKPLTQLAGIRAGDHDGVLVQKTMSVLADVDEVYECWRNLEGLPRFMSHVKEIRKVDDTHYHWCVDGPVGVPVEWDSEITADVPLELIAWRTVKDSPVQNSGVVQFEPTNFGGTRVHIRMIYRPPANMVGHTVARLFGRDAKHQLDDDLIRFKTFMETGGVSRRQRRQAEEAEAAKGNGATVAATPAMEEMRSGL